MCIGLGLYFSFISAHSFYFYFLYYLYVSLGSFARGDCSMNYGAHFFSSSELCCAKCRQPGTGVFHTQTLVQPPPTPLGVIPQGASDSAKQRDKTQQSRFACPKTSHSFVSERTRARAGAKLTSRGGGDNGDSSRGAAEPRART